ncbi:MAG: DUF2335 domain-containing protein [Candidatus Atribacteria bacterium]|nr:MAG: DUF2335 domain-containing protein [Candidatus Atribacteria bacterium]
MAKQKKHTKPDTAELVRREGSSASIKQTTISAASYQGPLPLPSHLEDYERILPGAAERIVALVERQSLHRQEIEKIVIRGDSKRAWAGLLVGGSLSLCCVVGGIVLVVCGQPTAGATIATASVVGLAGVFVYGTHSRRVERESRPILGGKSK